MRRVLLTLVPLLTATLACTSLAPEAEPEPDAVAVPWKAIVAVDWGCSTGLAGETRHLVEAAQAQGIVLTSTCGPDRQPLAVFGAADAGGVRPVIGTIDLGLLVPGESGWVFVDHLHPPLFQAAAPIVDIALAASNYFVVPITATASWQAVIAIQRDANVAFDGHRTLLEGTLGGQGVLVTTWDVGEADSISFPDVGAPVGSLAPAEVTDQLQGWIFAERGRPPVYQPPAPMVEVLRGAGEYFRLGVVTPPSREDGAVEEVQAAPKRQAGEGPRRTGGGPPSRDGRGGGGGGEAQPRRK